MKIERRLKKAMETPDPKLKYKRLIRVCLSVLPYCTIWKIARAEIDRLIEQGVKL